MPDVDADGAGDLLITAPSESFGGPGNAGRAYVFSGATGALLHALVSPNVQLDGGFGWAASGVADVDGDAGGDLAVSDSEPPGSSPYGAGQVCVFSGATGVLLYTLASPNAEEDGGFGRSIAGLPDVDGDGRGDVAIGANDAPGPSPNNAGRVYVFSGASGVLLHELASPNEQRDGLFGSAVAGVADADGDGRGDVLVGALFEGGGGEPRRAYVFSGATGTLLHTLTSPHVEEEGFFGEAVAGVEDVDGDARGDLLVGSYNESPGSSPGGAGRVYVFSGATGVLLHELVSPNEQQLGFFGSSVAGVSDVDDDGRGDVVVGAGDSPAPSPERAGRAYVFNGATGALLTTLVSPHEAAFGNFGNAVAGVEDADDDGRGDLLIGAWYEDGPSGAQDAGRAYLFSGAPTPIAVEDGAEPAPLTLAPPQPNPSGGSVMLLFSLAQPGPVRLSVYDLLGREVARPVDEVRTAGPHAVMFDPAASGLPSGVYVVRLSAGGGIVTQRLTLVR